jgi:HlyD family secretion protein
VKPVRLLAAAALAAAGATAACHSKGPAVPPIQTATVTRQNIVVDVEATGAVEPINVVEVKSKASGQIVKMPVETGSLVKPGDLLVQLDTRDVRNQYNQALADVRAAQANLEVAVAQKKRSDELLAQHVVTSQENEATALTYANAQAQLVRARTNLDLALQRLQDATVRAPVAGTVIEKDVSLGQVISSATGSIGGGTTLLKMADLNQVRVRALVDETDIGNVQPGQSATVTVDAYPDRPFRGVVEKIEPQAVVTQSVTQFPVLVTIQNREGLLKPGMNGEVSVLVSERDNVLAVPNDAVRNPREAATAAQALGLRPDSVLAQVQTQMQQFGRGRGAPGSGGTGAVGAADPAGAPTRAVSRGDVSVATPQQSGPQGAAQRARQGADRQRIIMRDPASAEVAAGVAGAGAARAGGAAGTGARPRSGLVFVGDSGKFAPRLVRLGVGNYDYTEVLGGLREGEKVALLSAATLQMQRSQMQERIRGMAGNGIPGSQRPPGGAGGTRRGGS